MFREIPNLYVHRVDCTIKPDRPVARAWAQSDSLSHWETLARVERYYHPERELELLLDSTTQDPESSYELARRTCRPSDRWLTPEIFVLAQSYADKEALATPLPRLMQDIGISPKQTLGLTHLGALAGTEILSAADVFLHGQGGDGYLVMNHSFSFRHQSLAKPTTTSGSSCTSLSVSNETGPLRVLSTGRFPKHETVVPSYLDSRTTLSLWQSSAGPVASGLLRTRYLDLDFHGSDVWVSLVECLESGKLSRGDRVRLFSVENRTVGYCEIEVMELPPIRLEVR